MTARRRSYRVEATVPAIQHVVATSKVEARAIAVSNPSEWDVDLGAPIEEDHIVDVEPGDFE